MQLTKRLIFLFSFTYCTIAFAQQRVNDTLLNNHTSDSSKIVNYNKLFKKFRFSDTLKAKEFLRSALELSKSTKNKQGLALTYTNFGDFYQDKGNYSEALNSCNIALNLAYDINDSSLIAGLFTSISNINNNRANYQEAVANILQSLKIYTKIQNENGIASSYQSLGNIYFSQDNYPLALKNTLLALELYKKTNNKYGLAYTYNNLGAIYNYLGNYREAQKNFSAALSLHKERTDKSGIALAYQNIGWCYSNQKKYDEANTTLYEALQMHIELRDKFRLSECYYNIASNLFYQKKYAEAKVQLHHAEAFAKEIGSKSILSSTYSVFCKVDSATKDYKNAYLHLSLSNLYRDSVKNEESVKKIIEAEAKREFDLKQEHLKSEQEKKDIIAKEALKQKQQQLNYFIIGFILVILLSAFIFKEYRQKQKANRVVLHQKKEVEAAKLLIEEKNKSINDSINYATHIQKAILPDINDIYKKFRYSFVLYKPKDIVSGDFYFFHSDNKRIYIAVADCTGHGVPGAFMSLIGTEKLKDAILQTYNTSQALQHLNREMKKTLKQSSYSSTTRDGMDIALCLLDTSTNTLTYSGANRPMWIIKKNSAELKEIKATKSAIGGLTDDEQEFTQTHISLEQGDTFYLSTDGYVDQFGGKEGKKLMAKRFKEELISIQHLSMTEQMTYLDSFIENWKNAREQVDDILVVGIRI